LECFAERRKNCITRLHFSNTCMTFTFSTWAILAIFVLTFIGIATEIINKAILAVSAAALCILLGLISEKSAGSFVDFGTLSLLFGMMIAVEIASMSGIFELMSVKILKFTQGRPLMIFLLFMTFTLFMSSVLNNVTTILIVLPLTIEITRGIGLNPRPFVFGEIFFANTGGLLTLIGDPVNTIMGTSVGLSMMQFIINLSIPVFIHAFVVLGFLYFAYKPQFKSIKGSFSKMLHNQLVISSIEQRTQSRNFNKIFMIISSAILVCTITGFLFADTLGVSAGGIALIGASAMLAMTFPFVSIEKVFRSLEWTTLLFFTGLFILVGAVEQTGVLVALAHSLNGITTNPQIFIGILMLLTAVVSAFVDNIPFVTIMIPIMRTISQGGMFSHSPDVLWWALSLAAVMGGMASPFGSSANIVALGTAAKSGYKVSTKTYLSRSLAVSGSGLLIAYIYLITAYAF
jgi:Na+/H+ antiporter NhaD/arsenite permease-like protein